MFLGQVLVMAGCWCLVVLGLWPWQKGYTKLAMTTFSSEIFFFHQALVFQASIVCKLCSATPSDVMKIVIYALCRMHLTLFGGDK
jgi:hypothetical protein